MCEDVECETGAAPPVRAAPSDQDVALKMKVNKCLNKEKKKIPMFRNATIAASLWLIVEKLLSLCCLHFL